MLRRNNRIITKHQYAASDEWIFLEIWTKSIQGCLCILGRYMKLFHTCDVLNPITFDIRFKHIHCFCFLVDTRYTMVSGVTEYIITIECPLTFEWCYMGATASQNTGNSLTAFVRGRFHMTSPCKLMTNVVQHTHLSWCDVSNDEISSAITLRYFEVPNVTVQVIAAYLKIWSLHLPPPYTHMSCSDLNRLLGYQ